MLFCGNKFGCRSSKKHEIDGCIKRRIYDTNTNNPILVCPSKNSKANSYALGLFFMHSSYLLLHFAFFLLWLLFFFVRFLCNSRVTQKKLRLLHCFKKLRTKTELKQRPASFRLDASSISYWAKIRKSRFETKKNQHWNDKASNESVNSEYKKSVA